MAATNFVVGAVDHYQRARSYQAEASATKQAGEAQARFMERDAAVNDAIALQNNRMMRRNAQSEQAAVRADNAVANLVADGTGLNREMDMAARLEHEINIQTDDALRQSSNMRNQAALTRWNTDVQAINLKRKASGSNMSALGNLAGAAAALGAGAWDYNWGAEKKKDTPPTIGKNKK